MYTKEIKLKEFSKSRYGTSIRPTVSFNKIGIGHFNAAAVDVLGFKVGDTIAFFQDENELKNWYVDKKEMSDIILRKNTRGKGLNFNNRLTANTVIRSCAIGHNSVRFPIAKERDDATGKYAIITITSK